MTNGTRSPFGELVHYHRLRLGLSRRKMVDISLDLAAAGDIEGSISVRTLGRIERVGSPADWHTPHMQTAHALAAVFGLVPGSAEHDAFIAAALTHPAIGTRDDTAAPEPIPAHDAPLEIAVDGARFFPAGRETQMERLGAAIDAAVAGRPGAVFVGADPGVGKTSLIAAACRQALTRHDRLTVLWTAAHDRPGPALRWEPFREMLSLMVGDLAIAGERELLSAGNASELGRRIPAAVQALVAESADLVGWLLPTGAVRNGRIDQALDPDLRQQLDQVIQRQTDATRPDDPPDEALFRMLARVAAEGPVVLVLEDLHWADEATAAALSHLLTRMAGRRLPLVVIGSYRPAELVESDGSAHPFTQVLRQASRHFPGALVDLSTAVGGAQGRAFVAAVVDAYGVPDPDPVAEALFQRTAGQPLVVVNMLRLLEPEEITPEAIRTLPLPESITMVFAEQVERLKPQKRELLLAASVQGDTFWADPVMQMLALDRDEFIELVDSRLVRQFGMLKAGPAEPVGTHTMHRYAFSHALLQNYLVDSLSDLERERWHERTAIALIELLGEKDHDATDRIAIHFDRAGNRGRAAVAWGHAGTRALEHRDFDQARAAFNRVLALNVRETDPTTHVNALVGLGNCYRGLTDLPAARQVLHQALELAVSRELPIAQGHALESMAMIDLDAGNIQSGVERLMTVIDLWSRADHDEAVRAMTNLSYLLYGLGRYEEAMDYAERSSTEASRMGDTREWISAQIGLANCLMDLGRYADAVAIYRPTLDASREADEPHLVYICRVNLSLAALEMEDWETAVFQARQVLDGDPEPAIHLVGFLEHHLGVVAEAREGPEAARRHYERSREIRESAQHEAVLVDSLGGLLRVAISTGELDTVRELRDDIAGRIATRGLDGIEHVARLYLTLIAASQALGDTDAAERYRRDGVAFLEERASRISDPAYRDSWLTNPSSHRRLMALRVR